MTTRRLRPAWALAALLTLSVFPGAGEADPPVVDKWGLWSAGTTMLRGANIYQRRVYPEIDGTEFLGPGPLGPPYTQADFDRLAALGANYVNISHPGLYTETPPYGLDTDVADNLDALLDMIRAAGMYAVISFRTGPGRSEFTFFASAVGRFFDASYLNDTVWADSPAGEAARAGWAAMWGETARRYKDDPIVVGYDLMVEPNANDVGSDFINDRLGIFDPATFYATYGGTSYDWNELYPAITTAIRTGLDADTTTPILIGAMSYSAVAWLHRLVPTGDAKTVYAVHQYEPFAYTHQLKPAGKCPRYLRLCDTDFDGIRDALLDSAWLDALLDPIDTFKTTHGVPVAVNEFGVARFKKDAALFLQDQMNLFEDRGLNYALWVWAPFYAPFVKVDHEFNVRLGRKKGNRKREVFADDALLDAITEAWARNLP